MQGNRGFNRRGTPKVKDGKVQKKNNWTRTPNYYNKPQAMPVIDKKKPGKGCRHVLSRRDIQQFIAIVPEWEELSKELNAIVLAPADFYAGFYTGYGTIHICAWEKDLWRSWTPRFFTEHKGVLERLGVPYEKDKDGDMLCKFNESTVRAWQLLHIFCTNWDTITTELQLAPSNIVRAEKATRRNTR